MLGNTKNHLDYLTKHKYCDINSYAYFLVDLVANSLMLERIEAEAPLVERFVHRQAFQAFQASQDIQAYLVYLVVQVGKIFAAGPNQ